MPTDFKLPELGENVTAGDVVRVLVNPGDTIAKDQPLLELETDKATIEVPSSVSGTVKEIKIKQGERVKVGQVVLTVDDGASSGNGKGPKEASAAADKPKPQPTGAPEEGGLSQQTPDSGPTTAATPPASSQPQAEAPEPKPKRGEVVDISRAARPAPAPAPAPVEAAPAGPVAPAAP